MARGKRLCERREKNLNTQFSVMQMSYSKVVSDVRIRKMHEQTIEVMSQAVFETPLLANIYMLYHLDTSGEPPPDLKTLYRHCISTVVRMKTASTVHEYLDFALSKFQEIVPPEHTKAYLEPWTNHVVYEAATTLATCALNAVKTRRTSVINRWIYLHLQQEFKDDPKPWNLLRSMKNCNGPCTNLVAI